MKCKGCASDRCASPEDLQECPECKIPWPLQTSETCYTRIRCAPNGSCLFIALGVAYKGYVSGFSSDALRTAEKIRALIKAYYHEDLWNLQTPFGTRKSILEREVSRIDDITDRDLERYVNSVTWGSTPEYLAFALLTNCSVEIYVPDDNVYKVRDRIVLGPRVLRLVFENQHYDALVLNRPTVFGSQNKHGLVSDLQE